MNTESFLQAPTPKQQIQSFADEVIAWEIILRSIETNNSGCASRHPQTSAETTQENNAFGSVLPDSANPLVKIPGSFALVKSLYTGVTRGWLRDIAIGTDLIPILLKRAVVSQQEFQQKKLIWVCFPRLLAN